MQPGLAGHASPGSPMRAIVLSFVLTLVLTPGTFAKDVTFRKTKFSSVQRPEESNVDLSVSDLAISIKSKAGSKAPKIDIDIPFTEIDAMSYERASRHRWQEGTETMLLSPAGGAILMATKTATHWLQIQYHEAGTTQVVQLQLDKSEYKGIIEALQANTGKTVATLKTTDALDPTAGSKDVDEVVPFPSSTVISALKPAMESQGCLVQKAAPTRVECRRLRRHSGEPDPGGESIVVTLEPEGEHTRVTISTQGGINGKAPAKNWSLPIYQKLLNLLERSSGPAAPHA